jgi:hypothetical protein
MELFALSKLFLLNTLIHCLRETSYTLTDRIDNEKAITT